MPQIAGTCVVTQHPVPGGLMLIFNWTSSSGGVVTYNLDWRVPGTPYQLETYPIGAPSDSYGITLTNPLGVDVLLGRGAARSGTSSQTTLLFDATQDPGPLLINLNVPPSSRVRANVAEPSEWYQFSVASAGNAKNGVARVWFKRQEVVGVA